MYHSGLRERNSIAYPLLHFPICLKVHKMKCQRTKTSDKETKANILMCTKSSTVRSQDFSTGEGGGAK